MGQNSSAIPDNEEIKYLFNECGGTTTIIQRHFNSRYNIVPVGSKTMTHDIILFSNSMLGGRSKYEKLLKFRTHDELRIMCENAMLKLFSDKIKEIKFTGCVETTGSLKFSFDISLR